MVQQGIVEEYTFVSHISCIGYRWLTQISLFLEMVTRPWRWKIWSLATDVAAPAQTWMSASTLNHPAESLLHKDVTSMGPFPIGPPESPSYVTNFCWLTVHSLSVLKQPRTPFTRPQRSLSPHALSVQVTPPAWHLHCCLQSALRNDSPS